ncbi:MAG: alkaline phosphatase family protein [Acidobacteriota bacterium]|nr:alkaline phosphatase family protein [Acidobacteriota bacterium]
MNGFDKKARAITAALLLLAIAPLCEGYIGPGAGFAFLSSFLVLFLTFFLALFSFLSWPFRFIWRLLKGQKAYKGGRVNRVVILGLDGMEPSLAEKFMAEGKMPHLSRLKKEGGYARLQTTTPAISPVAWSSFMTGSEPSKHNIFDFLSRDPRTYLPDLSSARIGGPKRTLSIGKYRIPLSKPEIRGMRRSIPFWKILGDRGIFSTVIRVPITFPPEKFRGHLLSGMCAPDLKGSQGTFSFYSSAKTAAENPEGGLVIPVEIKNGLITTYISGPENTLLKTPEEIRLPMTITPSDGNGPAVIEVSDQKIELPAGRFSPWIRLSFRPGLGMKIRAVCRFYISRMDRGGFSMYVTPLNIDPEKPALPISHPFVYSIYLGKLLGSYVTLGEANDTWALNEGALAEQPFLDLTYAHHEEWEAMLFNALEKTRKGVVISVFETTDSIQHMFWKYLDAKHPARKRGENRMSARVIEDLYVRMDGLVGRVREKLDGKSAFFVMSDHGFAPFRRGVNINTWLHQNGFLALKDGRDGSGEWFKDVDWDRTRAYGVGLGGIFINMKGREAQGLVAPGEEARKVKAAIISGLEALNDGPSPAVNRVFDRDVIYSGPYKDNAPDLLVGYNRGYRVSWDSVTGKIGAAVFEDNIKAWSGDHCIDPAQVPGVFFSNLGLTSDQPSIMDIAPSVLRLFGVPVPAHMDGRPIIADGPESETTDKGQPQ